MKIGHRHLGLLGCRLRGWMSLLHTAAVCGTEGQVLIIVLQRVQFIFRVQYVLMIPGVKELY